MEKWPVWGSEKGNCLICLMRARVMCGVKGALDPVPNALAKLLQSISNAGDAAIFAQIITGCFFLLITAISWCCSVNGEVVAAMAVAAC